VGSRLARGRISFPFDSASSGLCLFGKVKLVLIGVTFDEGDELFQEVIHIQSLI
jgi:hypothetical protein